MSELYEDTALTPLRVAKLSGYIDWSSQPSMFKHYPNFLFRYKYEENSALRVVELSRIITSQTMLATKPYNQLNLPSAGNLHPVELYVQIRSVKGVLSGIYHVDAGTSEIVLIREIEDDGLEPHVGLSKRVKGMMFVVSAVPFRAQWKYHERSVRYCYLDVGHQVAAVGTSLKLFAQEMTILSDIDRDALNEVMGFKNEEFVSAVLLSGELSDKSVKALKQNLMYVMPTDYSELESSVIENISKSELLKSSVPALACELSEEHILRRRSARVFDTASLSSAKLEHFLWLVKSSHHSLTCYNVVLKDEHIKAGVYKSGKLVKEGAFSQTMASLLVDQSFVKNADVVTVITSKYFSANKLIQAGAYVHNLYMEAEVNGFGFTGIGAFYDKKLQDFLESEEYILYVGAAGEEKK